MGLKPGVRVLVCLVSIHLIVAYGYPDTEDISCETKETCAACIRTPQCVWCADIRPIKSEDAVENIPEQPRCTHRKFNSESWCRIDLVVDKNETLVLNDDPFSSQQNNQTQVKPQHVKISLRRQEELRINISYQQANDYPVDLYFLMDLSASMEPYRNNLAKLGAKVVEAMGKLTSNFHLGFGSFIDKVVLPMTNTEREWLLKMCKLKDGTPCALPYEFKHQMKLGTDVSLFTTKVEKAEISANLDVPEGGLDGLMQAIVCQHDIGWRKNARRLLVYSSDATYHIAGDGKLAGIVEPNDETCHLDEKGAYTHAEILDYPSITQINKQIQKNSINVIFDVTKAVSENYRDLSLRINGSSVGLLDSKSDNKTVVDIILSQYETLTNSITMTSSHPEFIEVKFFSRCMNQSAPLSETNECGGIRVNKSVQFEISIKAIECPERPEDWHQIIEIKPQGVDERLTIEVDLICDCPCSKPDNGYFKANAPECHGQGNLACGICECNKYFQGKDCYCPRNGPEVTEISSTGCVPANATKAEPCSGKNRGKCVCGKCECLAGPKQGDKYMGKFCECDNFSCPRSNLKVCGGPSRGTCYCGKCKCKPGWNGDSCECSTSNTCINPVSEKVCSGFGECKCGICECDTTKGRTGQYCQDCPTCSNQYCETLKDCVECYVHKTGLAVVGDGCDSTQCGNVEVSEKVETIDEPEADSKYKKCVVPDDNGCTFAFKYEVGGYQRGDQRFDTVIAEKKKKCSALPLFSPLTTAAGVILLTLFLGLLGLLAWKAVTMFHDHREYVKFEKERVCATYEGGTNPIYKAAKSTFNNPMFGTESTAQ
ncbi:integrin beta-PS-like [Neodiprion pinetum]|uniref:integrin beta-PS-like n=1 Tax=Neodiprion pinetum TaxID=441929 RepID=UPI001EDE7805|nr:integrin beta-PS-like [Neodiprion pinetum]